MCEADFKKRMVSFKFCSRAIPLKLDTPVLKLSRVFRSGGNRLALLLLSVGVGVIVVSDEADALLLIRNSAAKTPAPCAAVQH
jgi:hypothetical protein